MPKGSIDCIYCGATNPSGTSRCVSCGAPIDIPITPPIRVTTVNTPQVVKTPLQAADTTPEQINDALDAAPISDQLKEGLKTAGASIGALGIGAFFARTAAEACSIGLSAFLLGYFSAATRNFLLGLFGSMLIGLMVGLVTKRSLGTLLSAPLGTIAGLVASNFLQPSLPGWPLAPVLGLAGGSLLALLGGRRNTNSGIVKWYTRLRPFLGMAGGFLFALFGYAIGGLAR